MRALLLLILAIPLCCFAAESPHIELVSREGLTTHLRIINSSDQEAFFSPYIVIEEFYDKPACDGCSKGWIATRPRSLGKNVSADSGGSYKFDAPTSFRPTRITVFSAPTASATKDDFKPVRIELPAIERTAAAPQAESEIAVQPTKEEKRKKIVYNLRMIAAAGDQCLMRNGISSADITVIARDFPDEMKEILVAVDGEDYSKLVYAPDTTLIVETKTLGTIKYPEK